MLEICINSKLPWQFREKYRATMILRISNFVISWKSIESVLCGRCDEEFPLDLIHAVEVLLNSIMCMAVDVFI